MDGDEKYWDGRENHPKRRILDQRIPIFYQQFERKYRVIFQSGTGPLERRKYALASGCDLSRGCKSNVGSSGGAESEHYSQMVFEHPESCRVIPSKFIHEKETFHYQYGPLVFFESGPRFLKNFYSLIFGPLTDSCVCRGDSPGQQHLKKGKKMIE